MTRRLLLLLALVGLGCVDRWEDPDKRVTCWTYTVVYAGGIHCLPESEVQPR